MRPVRQTRPAARSDTGRSTDAAWPDAPPPGRRPPPHPRRPTPPGPRPGAARHRQDNQRQSRPPRGPTPHGDANPEWPNRPVSQISWRTTVAHQSTEDTPHASILLRSPYCSRARCAGGGACPRFAAGRATTSGLIGRVGVVAVSVGKRGSNGCSSPGPPGPVNTFSSSPAVSLSS